MFLLKTAEQIALLVVICFSFSNFTFALSLNKKRSFLRILGISFSVPLMLSILTVIYPLTVFQLSLLYYTDFLLLVLLVLLCILWRRHNNYQMQLLLITSYIIMVLFGLRYVNEVSNILWLTQILIFLAILCPIIIIGLTKKEIKDGGLFYSALLIMGICQAALLMFPAYSQFSLVIGKSISYFLLFYYLCKKNKEPYINKIKEANEKLGDLSKTINIEVKKRVKEIEQHNEYLQNLARIDGLTNAFNKKAILGLIKNMVEEPNAEHFTILIFDIDNFKNINDTLGHISGDRVLKKVAQIAKNNIREIDNFGRYGGDEFIIVLPRTTISDVLFVAERFRKKIKEGIEGISVSIGVAEFPKDGKSENELLVAADRGLYHSKMRGKNAVSHNNESI
ncbi:MAG: GGDEF domain-containing protein [Eubacteriales bacterium]